MITDNAEKIVDHSIRLFDGLDEFALAVGHYRISLLDVVTWTVTALLLYFAARFAYYLLKKAVRRSGRLDSTQQLLVEKISGLAIFALAVLTCRRLRYFRVRSAWPSASACKRHSAT